MENNDNKKKTLNEYYTSLSSDEKVEFEIAISKKCMKALGTIRQWVYSCRNPPALCKKIIAEHLKMPVNDLFPKKVVNEEAL